MSKGTAAEWDALQAAYRKVSDEQNERRIATAVAGYETAAAIRERRKGMGRLSKAQDRCYAWLDKHSPWEWREGVASVWVCRHVSAADVLSATPPTIPERANAFGAHQRERPARLRETSAE